MEKKIIKKVYHPSIKKFFFFGYSINIPNLQQNEIEQIKKNANLLQNILPQAKKERDYLESLESY